MNKSGRSGPEKVNVMWTGMAVCWEAPTGAQQWEGAQGRQCLNQLPHSMEEVPRRARAPCESAGQVPRSPQASAWLQVPVSCSGTSLSVAGWDTAEPRAWLPTLERLFSMEEEECYGRLGGSQPQGPRGDFAQVPASRLIPRSSPPLELDSGARVAQATQGLRRELKSEVVKSGLRVLTLSVPSAAGDKAEPIAFSVFPRLSLWVTTAVSLSGSTEDWVWRWQWGDLLHSPGLWVPEGRSWDLVEGLIEGFESGFSGITSGIYCLLAVQS